MTKIRPFLINGMHAAELVSGDLLIVDAASGSELLVDLYYQHFDIILLHEKNIDPSFFELNTGIAGELLQKATNFKLRLAFIGNFGAHSSKSLHDFIRESNRQGRILFVSTIAEAVSIFERS